MDKAAYSGKLDVDEEGFDLNAVTVIVGPDGVLFNLDGNYADDGKFEVSGRIGWRSSGVSERGEFTIRYKRFSDAYLVTLQFTEVRVEGDFCVVRGLWLEAGESWTFEGRLSRKSRSEVAVP